MVEGKNGFISAEFDSAERDFSFRDSMYIARDLVRELNEFDSKLRRSLSKNEDIKYRQAVKGGSLRHFYLPQVLGGNGEIDQIREVVGVHSAEYAEAGERKFVTVEQGRMWVVKKSERPYLMAYMSECSLLVGHNTDEIVAAHISYSEADDVEKVLRFMKGMGIKTDQIHVVASVGGVQSSQSVIQGISRVDNVGWYERLGIPVKNIIPFEYNLGELTSEHERVRHGLAGVLVSNRGLFKWGFDLKTTYGKDTYGNKDQVIETNGGEVVVEF